MRVCAISISISVIFEPDGTLSFDSGHHHTCHAIYCFACWLIGFRLTDAEISTLGKKRLLDCAVTPEDAGQRAVDNSQPTADVRPGTMLGREWKGRMHRVAVLSDGFAWNGKTYPSLSRIAHAITGTRWNGPRF